MFLVALDIRTLSFITVLFAFGLGAGLLAFGMVYDAFSGLRRVGGGLLVIGLAFLLIGLRHLVPPFWSLVAGNTLIVVGLGCINRGIQSFRNISGSDVWLSLLSIIATGLLLAYYAYVQPSTSHRIFWVCTFLAFLSVLCCRNMLRQSRGGITVPQKMLATGFVLFGAFMLLRAVWVMDESPIQDFMSAGFIHGFAFLAIILLMLSTTFGLVWMANEMLLQDLRQYEQIIISMPEGIALVDGDGRYQMVNEMSLRLTGVPSLKELLGKRSLDVFGPEFYEGVTMPNVRKALAGEVGVTSSWLQKPDGTKGFMTISYYPVPDVKGRNKFVAIHTKDMTALHNVLKEKQRIFDLSLDMLSAFGMNGELKEVNPAWTKTLGWRMEDLLSSNWLKYVHPEDAPDAEDAMQQLRQGEPVVDLVLRYRTRDGQYRHVAWTASPDRDGGMIYSVARDVSGSVQREEELMELSITDPLTKAYNRRFFMQRLDAEIENGQRHSIPLSLFAIDIDHFKHINDTYGHAMGDKVLQRCVETCKQALRTTDVFGRIGGEEFQAMLPYAGIDVALETAERLRRTLARCSGGEGDDLPPFTVSIGVADLQPDDTAEGLQKRADEALYRAKENGRDRVERG